MTSFANSATDIVPLCFHLLLPSVSMNNVYIFNLLFLFSGSLGGYHCQNGKCGSQDVVKVGQTKIIRLSKHRRDIFNKEQSKFCCLYTEQIFNDQTGN